MKIGIFDNLGETEYWQEEIAPTAFLLHGFALRAERQLLVDLDKLIQVAPFRQMLTPGGLLMSVAMTNCGQLGWLSDERGYRYEEQDPLSGRPWPPMPNSFLALAAAAAVEAGFAEFQPDACLINRYVPGAKLSLHQDKDELNLAAPIVSVSLGIPAIFLFGGLKRTDKTQRIHLGHGDVVVWGGASRLCYHGILPVKEAYHPLVGDFRINLTLRKAR